MRAILLILDSVGIGAAPDAADYGDAGSATLPHIAQACGGLKLPMLQSLGLGNIPALLPGGLPIIGVPPAVAPLASFGALHELSEGKDTVTGHWELAGLCLHPGFRIFPHDAPSFPPELLGPFEKETGRGVLGNKAASGMAIIDEFGAEHARTGKWIVYTSGDSVFQIAAHNDVIPIAELWRGCEVARRLCDPYRIGRVIARPFTGPAGAYVRTEDRRDYAFKPEEPTVLERLTAANVPVYAVGKIEDIYAHRGITKSIHSGNTHASQDVLARFTRELDHDGVIIANFIDFDMNFGHRRDARGYGAALEQTDSFLAGYLKLLGPDDLLLITADHGNDPTYRGSDHTREFVPLLAYQPGTPARNLGIRNGFFDVAQSLATRFRLAPLPRGVSFLPK